MKVDDRRACPACGAENPQASAYCWQCYGSFTSMPAPPTGSAPAGGMPVAPPTGNRPGMPGAGMRPGMPSTWDRPVGGPTGATGPAAPAPATRGLNLVRVLVGAAVAAASAFGVQRLLNAPPELPDRIGGSPRVTSETARDFEDQMEKLIEPYGVQAAAGVYGTAEPDLFALVIEGSTGETTDELFDAFVDGVAASGATVDPASTSGSRGGAEYRCVDLTAESIQGAACMWREDDTMGIVLRLYADSTVARDQLFALHDALG